MGWHTSSQAGLTVAWCMPFTKTGDATLVHTKATKALLVMATHLVWTAYRPRPMPLLHASIPRYRFPPQYADLAQDRIAGFSLFAP